MPGGKPDVNRSTAKMWGKEWKGCLKSVKLWSKSAKDAQGESFFRMDRGVSIRRQGYSYQRRFRNREGVVFISFMKFRL